MHLPNQAKKNIIVSFVNKIFKIMRPASRGRFFERYSFNTNEYKRLIASKSKYNITKSLSRREQINKQIWMKKLLSPVTMSLGKKLW